MKPDRTAFAFGIAALVLAGLGFWASYGQINWQTVSLLAPVALVVIGVGMLVLSRAKH